MDALSQAKTAMSGQYQSELREKLKEIRTHNRRLTLEAAFNELRRRYPELVKAIDRFEKEETGKPPSWPVVVRTVADDVSEETWDRFCREVEAFEREGAKFRTHGSALVGFKANVLPQRVCNGDSIALAQQQPMIWVQRLFVFFALIGLAATMSFADQGGIPHQPHTSQVTLAWDASTTTDVTGYRLWIGFAPGGETQPIDVGNSLTTTVKVTNGTTYFFVVTAYDPSGESLPSNEVTYIAP
jgi:hypothetical protein